MLSVLLSPTYRIKECLFPTKYPRWWTPRWPPTVLIFDLQVNLAGTKSPGVFGKGATIQQLEHPAPYTVNSTQWHPCPKPEPIFTADLMGNPEAPLPIRGA